MAEQFVLSRAAAVIVHSLGLQHAAEERGAARESIFLIPDPLPPEDSVILPAADVGDQSLRARFGPGTNAAFFVPQFTVTGLAALHPEQLSIVESFALARNETSGLCLVLEALAPMRSAIEQYAASLGLADEVLVVDAADSVAAWQSADVIIATGDPPANILAARQANEICLAAVCRGKALLAADLPRNRDVTPDGRGCLWFERNNPRDLAARIAFLGNNPGFRSALAAAGHFYIHEIRSSAAIGKKYRDAYLHAFSRKRFTGPGTGMASLQPAANWS